MEERHGHQGQSDSPKRPLRAEALRRGITVFVPTPRLRGGFKKLDPRRIPPDKIETAASLSRGDRWSEEVALADMPGLDAIVCGSVAVNRRRMRNSPSPQSGKPVTARSGMARRAGTASPYLRATGHQC